MGRHFHKELDDLKAKLLSMGMLVEGSIEKACNLIFDSELAYMIEIEQNEEQVNRYEIEIDDLGHSLFALGQPVAVDLRLMTMILKINTDLERIGDHAINIAECGVFIIKQKPGKIDERIRKMAELVQNMLRNALDSFIREDDQLARKVLESDDAIDTLHYEMFKDFKEKMELKPELVQVYLNLIMVSHNLERIGDLANNIAEDVIYWRKGVEIRHRIAFQD